jgi:8-hydroxy-5-deazaflavin:NADPH oxidoreductase
VTAYCNRTRRQDRLLKPEKVKSETAKHGKKATAGNFAGAAAFEEINCNSIRGNAKAIMRAGDENFAGRVVIDITNPLEFSNGIAANTCHHTDTDSGGETVYCILCYARVVKAFNVVGNYHMFLSDFLTARRVYLCAETMNRPKRP